MLFQEAFLSFLNVPLEIVAEQLRAGEIPESEVQVHPYPRPGLILQQCSTLSGYFQQTEL